MKTIRSNSRRAPALAIAALATSLTLVLSSCAGSAGDGTGDGGGEGSGEGFAYDASQEEVNALTEDLDPITITFQSPAASPNSVLAPHSTAFKEIVEERSNGKITVDIVWGQAIAGYAEVHDALADGRLDVAHSLPAYQPAEFPAIDSLGTVTAGLSPSPYVGDLVTHAVVNELAWQNENVLSQYEEKGLVPLVPLMPSGGSYSACTNPVVTAKDWDGRQVRVASTAHSEQVQGLGGSPVSLDYTDVFGALQRGIIDCSIAVLSVGVEGGLFEVAPHIGYTTDVSFARTPMAYLAGSSFQSMPSAYQQIIFDSTNLTASSALMKAMLDGSFTAISQAKKAGGGARPFGDDVQQELVAISEELIDEAIGNGHIDEDIISRLSELEQKWNEEVESLGHSDEGTVADFDEWYDESADYTDYARSVYENSGALNHRPS